MVTRVDKKPIIYNTTLLRVWKPAVSSSRRGILDRLKEISVGANIPRASVRSIIDDYEDIEMAYRVAGIPDPSEDVYGVWCDEEEDEALRIARMSLQHANSKRSMFKNASMMEEVSKAQDALFGRCDKVYYGTEAVYQLFTRMLCGHVFLDVKRPRYKAWVEESAKSVLVTQSAYMLVHPVASHDFARNMIAGIDIYPWYAWDLYKKIETVALKISSKKNLLAHAFHYGVNKRGFEPADNVLDDFEIQLREFVTACEGFKVYIIAGVKYFEINGVVCCLSGDDCVNLATMAQCYYRTSIYFSRANGYAAGDCLKAQGLLKDIAQHACKLIDGRKNFSHIIRSMHILAQGDFNDAFEDELGVDLGWKDRSDNYIREAHDLDPMGKVFHQRALDLASNQMDKLNVGFIYHAFIGDDMQIEDLRSKVKAMPKKVLDADGSEWERFIKFCKAYLLCRFMFTHRRKPKCAGALKLLNDSWAESCVAGNFRMPPQSDWGEVWISGEFTYTNFADTWHLEAQDVAHVPKDSEGLKSGKYIGNRTVHSELLTAMTSGNILDSDTASTPRSARDRICSGGPVREVVLTTAPKAENAKPSWKKRVTFAADCEFRKMQAEYDKNCRKVMSFIRGPSLGVDQSILESQFKDIAFATALGTQGAICSHDISAWSESMDRGRKFEFEKVLIDMLDRPDMINIQLDWAQIKATVFKQGCKDIVALDNGSFQGFDGSASSILHSLILLYCIDTARRADVIPSGVKTNMATLIDDCVALMEGLVVLKQANAFWSHLKETYRKLGFEVDELKSIFSNIKAIYLSRRFVNGGEVPSDFKVFVKTHSSYEDPLRCSLDVPSDIFGALRGAVDANGNAWYCYMSAVVSTLAELVHSNPVIAAIPPAAAAVFALAPRTENGWGFPSLIDWCTNDVLDKRCHFNAILESLATHACTDVKFQAGIDVYPRSVGQAILAIKSQPWRLVSYANIFSNPFEALREGPLKPDMLKRNAIQDILSDVATASPWKELLKWNSSTTTTRIREMLINSGHLHAPTLSALVNCMPDSYRLSLVGKAEGSMSLLDLLGKGERGVLKRRITRCSMNYFKYCESVYRMTKGEYSQGDFQSLTFVERTKLEREEFYAANGVSMLDHTFPDPLGTFTTTKNNMGSVMSPNSMKLMKWDQLEPKLKKPNQLVAPAGMYVPRKSSRVWEVTSEYAKGWDSVSQRIAMGLAILARARADGHGVNGLQTYFIKSWNEVSNITPRDTHLISIHGSIKRLDANPGSSIHPITCHRNMLRGFHNKIKTALEAIPVKCKEKTGGTSHLHDFLAHETCILAATALHFTLYFQLGVADDNLQFFLATRPDCVCPESAAKMTTDGLENVIDIEIMESADNYGLLQACPELACEIAIPTMKYTWVSMVNALIDGDHAQCEEIRREVLATSIDDVLRDIAGQDAIYSSSVIIAAEPAERNALPTQRRDIYTMKPYDQDQRTKGDNYTTSIKTMGSKFSRMLSKEQPAHIAAASAIRSVVWSRLKQCASIDLAKILYQDPDMNMDCLKPCGTTDFWRGIVSEIARSKRDKLLSESTMMGFKSLGVPDVHIKGSDDIMEVTQSVASFFGAHLRSVALLISDNITSIAGRKASDFEKPLMERIITHNPSMLNTRMRKEHIKSLIEYNRKFLKERIEAIKHGKVKHRGDIRACDIDWHARLVELRCRLYVYNHCVVDEQGAAVLNEISHGNYIHGCALMVAKRLEVGEEKIPDAPVTFRDTLDFMHSVDGILDTFGNGNDSGWDSGSGSIGSRFALSQVVSDSNATLATQFAISAAEIAPRLYRRIIVSQPGLPTDEGPSLSLPDAPDVSDSEVTECDSEEDFFATPKTMLKLPIDAWKALYALAYGGVYSTDMLNNALGTELTDPIKVNELREARFEEIDDDTVYLLFPHIYGDYIHSGAQFDEEWLNRDQADAYTTDELGKAPGGHLF